MTKKKTRKKEPDRTWKRAKTSTRRKSGKKSPLSGIGRYIVLTIVLAVLIRFGGATVVERIKQHPVFTIRRVVVEGADYINPVEIKKTASVQTGINIFDVDLVAVSRTLKKMYAAEDFIIYQRLPDTIAIRVLERKPVALLNVHEIIGVDAEGVPLPHVGASLVEKLPIVTGVDNFAALSDTTVRKRLVTGLRLLGRISEESPAVYGRISEIDVTSVTNMGITLIDDGLEVIIGPDDWGRKIPMLETVIDRVSAGMEKVKAVDIRFVDKVFVRKK